MLLNVQNCLERNVMERISALPVPQQCMHHVLWRLSWSDNTSGGATGYGVCWLAELPRGLSIDRCDGHSPIS
jgi:hypothetical protein